MLIHKGHTDCYEDCLSSNWLHKANMYRPIQKSFKLRLENRISSISLKQHLATHKGRYIWKTSTKGYTILRILHTIHAHTQIDLLSFHKDAIADVGLKYI